MHYILTGFRQDQSFRVFSFQRIESGQTTTNLTIRADISLAQKYDIRLQDLPLLCRGVLEHAQDGEGSLLTYSEEEMRLHQSRCVEDLKVAQAKKKAIRRPVPSPANHTSSYWRSDTTNKTLPISLEQPVAKD